MAKPIRTLLLFPPVALLLAAGNAAAQAEAPNVLLLVDSSGSMEYKVGFNSAGKEVFPQCDPTDPVTKVDPCPPEQQIQIVNDELNDYAPVTCYNNERSRWVTLVEVLTGSITDYRCAAVDRSSGDFTSLFDLGSNKPPDYGYRNRYHRPISGNCAPAPKNVGLPDQTISPKDEIIWREWDDYTGSGASTCTGTYQDNGLLDQLVDDVRFGLMTFDTDPNPKVGDGNLADGIEGTWSYWSDGSSVLGRPDGCSTWSDMEVGARNAFAPAWEGRLVGFGPPASLPDADRNEAIQKVLLATRPYGATPIAGMMTDAYYYLYEDTQEDPLSPGNDLGPGLGLSGGSDTASNEGCRENNIILLTDGEPNLDLRGYCTGVRGVDANGNCPFETAADIAHKMAHPTGTTPATRTYVVGFAMAAVKVGGEFKDCANLNPLTDCTENTIEKNSDTPRALRACCVLNEIAYSGDSGHAYFAKDGDKLLEQLAEIFHLIASKRPYHTRPVFGSAGVAPGAVDGNNISTTYRFFTGFMNGPGTRRGIIQRQRWSCEDADEEAKPVAFDASKGDYYVANTNADGGSERHFVTVRGVDGTGYVRAERSLRPFMGTDADGIGTRPDNYAAIYVEDDESNFAEDNFGAEPNSRMLGEEDDGTPKVADPDDAKQMVRWWTGQSNELDPTKHRCPTRGAADCNLIADVDYSTPAIVGRPNAMLPDESYSSFESQYANRPLVLYVSTNDGFLHAFQAYPEVTPVGTNNELWAFAPPAVLPELPAYFGSGIGRLNDGSPIVRDVVATQQTNQSFKFERTTADLQTGAGLTWRTTLVQSYGTRTSTDTQSGYFALDVTWPDPTTPDPVYDDDTKKGGPKFLWQLTTDADGVPLFGDAAGTPLITTLFFEPDGAGDGEGAREVPVAILPGGTGVEDTSASGCTINDPDAFPLVDSVRFATRSNEVRCWETASIGARSLTIVRLDTGEIVRTFRRKTTDVPGSLDPNRVLDTPLVAPITGRPAPFPGGTGAIADRVYVGDAEGVLWRVDLSSTNPSDWKMNVMFDAFNEEANPSGTKPGQPIVMAPILSTNRDNEVVVLLATGEPDPAKENSELNLIWSLTETKEQKTAVNWYFIPTSGERVSGEMQLFNEVLYFSTYRASGLCYEQGESRVYGMHYVTPEEGDDKKGGEGKLELEEKLVQSLTLDQETGVADDLNANVYGVAVVQVPTCSTDVDSTAAYGGGHTQATNVRQGKFQLVVQKGNVTDAGSGAQVDVVTIDLPTPQRKVRIDSWAAILE